MTVEVGTKRIVSGPHAARRHGHVHRFCVSFELDAVGVTRQCTGSVDRAAVGADDPLVAKNLLAHLISRLWWVKRVESSITVRDDQGVIQATGGSGAW